MPAKWQQWMPFRIDAFKSSPAVQAMHPAARCGYLYLLSCAWQTEDCTISADPFDLAEMSGLGDELWAIHGPRILRKFTALESGRLQNEILFEEWKVAKKVFDRRQDAANRTNKHRWSIGDRSVTDLTPNRSANTRTGTETVTTTEKRKTIARSVPPEELAGTLPLVDGTEYQISKSQVAEWTDAFPAVDVRQQLKEFKAWLNANPTKKKTPKGICKSIVYWLSNEQDKAGRIPFNGNGRHPPQEIDVLNIRKFTN